MTNTLKVLAALTWFVPAVALAHGADGHPPDPNLHVDPSVDDCSVRFAPELSQAAFGRFVREFGSVSAFKLMSSPRTLGQWGFSIGIEEIFFHVEEHSDAWNDTFTHPDDRHELGSDLAFPKLRLRVGVTDDLDLGAYYTEQPNANYGWLGFEAKYGLLGQSESMPISLAVRGAYTKTLYVDDMDMHAVSLDVAAGRTFWGVLTPYLGLGSDLVVAAETSDAVELDTEAQVVPHLVGGVEARFWYVALGVEAQLATVPSFQLQIAAVL